jgi:hypothetical protein
MRSRIDARLSKRRVGSLLRDYEAPNPMQLERRDDVAAPVMHE